jgi:hypothetical protein
MFFHGIYVIQIPLKSQPLIVQLWIFLHTMPMVGQPGPYYPLGTIGTAPRAYDICKAYEGTEGRRNKN